MRFDDIDAVGRAQHGNVTAGQLETLGATRDEIRGMRERGHVVAVVRGVYRLAGAPHTWRSSLCAATLAGGDTCRASHRAATAMWDLEGAIEDCLDVIAERHRRSISGLAVVHDTVDLPAADRAVIDGIRCTSIERTLIDVGRYQPPRLVGAQLDHAVRDGLTTYERFDQRVNELGRQGRNGIGVARLVLQHRGYGDGWGFERRMRTAMRDAGLPDPEREYPVRVDGHRYRLDFAYPTVKLGIECDSRAWHTLPHQIDRDLSRQNALLGAGWFLLRYTLMHLRESPAAVMEEIQHHLARLSALLEGHHAPQVAPKLR